MPAILSTPEPTTFQPVRRPVTLTGPEPHASGAGLAQLICGGGLIVYGLLRGSWPGLTLAAVGGFLVYRGLKASPLAPVDRRPLPPQDGLQGGAARARMPAVALPPVEGETRQDQDLVHGADSTAAPPPSLGMGQREELTPEEHAEAEAAAYYHALRRGGGNLPPYEQAMAVEDFWRAAEVVLRRRVGG